MGTAERALKAIDSERKNVFLTFLGALLTGLESTYSSGLSVYLASERYGIRRRMVAPIPVVSVGNLSVGGTGKTPATIMLGRAFQKMGLKVAVLSRGHGGTASAFGAVVSDDHANILLTTEQSGDEPMVLARAMPGIPVLVGKDRRKTAQMAAEQFSPDLLLLDDGFQYWQLFRDVDIVLLDATRPFENGHCLPRGLLREPKENLRRAHFVIVTRAAHLSIAQRSDLLATIKALAPRAKTFFSRHVGTSCIPANSAAESVGTPMKALALCAVARPLSFIETLEGSGISPVATMFLADHYEYSPTDERRIIGKMKSSQAQTIVTTQKDFVKLERLISYIPVFVQPVEFQVEDQNGLLTEVLDQTTLPATLAGVSKQTC